MSLMQRLQAFFFEPITSRGFSLMRAAWAFVTGLFLLMQWNDVTAYYSDAGIFPSSLTHIFARTTHRFTVFEWAVDPAAVFCIYLILLLALFCMMIGLWPRLMTIVSVLLLFSFHERNPFVLGGGDTLLRNIGFLLMLAPGIHGFSVRRLKAQWHHWKKKRTFLKPPTMPVWPWRLLLWQLIILYLTTLWYKLLGNMWWNGTAIEATLHHPIFVRWPMSWMHWLMPFASMADYLTLLWLALWGLLLVPKSIATSLLGPLAKFPLKRWILLGGILFHGGIFIIMDAGVFSLAVFVAYIGLLRDEDFAWMKKFLNKEKETIIVLFDGDCGLCLRSIFTLKLLDHLKRLQFVNFRDGVARKKVAPQLTEKTLDKAMHIKLESGEYLKGFDGVRYMAWHLPTLWIFVPLLYVPGVAGVGRRVYRRIAAGRKRCDHENCSI